MTSPDEPTDSDDSGDRRSSSDGGSPLTRAMRDVAPYLDLGWRLASAAAFPPIIGYLGVDLWLGTAPLGLLVGAVLGLAGALLQLKRLKDDLDQ